MFKLSPRIKNPNMLFLVAQSGSRWKGENQCVSNFAVDTAIAFIISQKKKV